MIGKIMKAASFRGCVQYVTGKEGATILASDGVLLGSVDSITESFEYQRQMNMRIPKPVGHIALSFKPDDKDKLTDKMMTKIALEYMELMGIKDTQFLLVRHHDNNNPHCHLVYNRINFHGRTISDQNDFRRNEKVTKQLKDKYGLTYGKGKLETKTERLRGTERTKYEIHNIIMLCLYNATSFAEFKQALQDRGVTMEYVMRPGHEGSKYVEDLQGLRFTKDGKTFKASQIRRGLTYQKIVSILSKNAQKEHTAKVSQQHVTHCEQSRQEPKSQSIRHEEPSVELPSLGLFDTTNPAIDPTEEEFTRRMQQKKKRRGPRI